MNTLEKEFVPYEPSLDMKELGFDEPCLGYWNIDPYLPNPTFNMVRPFDHEWCMPAPLYQQAFRWFREKYNLDSWIQPFTSEKSNGVLYLPDESYSYFIFKDGVWVDDKVDFSEPEEAELACLIKLIEIVKNK